jgi:hypothetical protein
MNDGPISPRNKRWPGWLCDFLDLARPPHPEPEWNVLRVRQGWFSLTLQRLSSFRQPGTIGRTSLFPTGTLHMVVTVTTSFRIVGPTTGTARQRENEEGHYCVLQEMKFFDSSTQWLDAKSGCDCGLEPRFDWQIGPGRS